jgi:hypothetical protein
MGLRFSQLFFLALSMEGSLFMRDSEGPGFHLVVRIIGALAVFFALDAAIFRSSLYSQILSPESIVGTAAYYLRYERQREPSHRKDVLVIGDSQVGEGFWAGLANSNSPQSDLYFVQGGIPGATLRVLYFYQKILDPNRDRYKAIVICLPTYRKKSSTEAEHLNDRMLDADFLLPVVGAREYLDFSSTYTTEEKRLEVASKVLVHGMSYKLDFQNLVFHPFMRMRLVAWRRWIKDRVALDYAGRDESMVGLRYDSRTGAIQFPDRLSEGERALVTDYLLHPGAVDADHYDEYSRQWIERFIERYRGTQTTLVFVRLPGEVLPQADEIRRNGPFASYMPLLRNSPGIRVIEEDAFYPLEDPRYFFDTLHMNREGRRLFTIQLSERLAKTL